MNAVGRPNIQFRFRWLPVRDPRSAGRLLQSIVKSAHELDFVLFKGQLKDRLELAVIVVQGQPTTHDHCSCRGTGGEQQPPPPRKPVRGSSN